VLCAPSQQARGTRPTLLDFVECNAAHGPLTRKTLQSVLAATRRTEDDAKRLGLLS
jgi:hypothetical protein